LQVRVRQRDNKDPAGWIVGGLLEFAIAGAIVGRDLQTCHRRKRCLRAESRFPQMQR